MNIESGNADMVVGEDAVQSEALGPIPTKTILLEQHNTTFAQH